jgi:hypothetical protein
MINNYLLKQANLTSKNHKAKSSAKNFNFFLPDLVQFI